MPKAASKNENTLVAKLINDISKIYEKAIDAQSSQVNQLITAAHWKIGKEIVEVELGDKERAPYGANLLDILSSNLNKKYRKGFSARNLRYMRKFYAEYNIKEIDHSLSWTHYRTLLRVDDLEKRAAFEKMAVQKNWTNPQLEMAIKFEPLKGKKSSVFPILKRPSGKLFLYRLAGGNIQHLELEVPNVDCGFKIWRNIKLNGIESPKSGEIVESRKSGRGYSFGRSSESFLLLYTYLAYLDRVIDGDTVIMHVDCGFDTYSRQRLRLRKVNAPDLPHPGAEKAKKYIEKSIAKDRPVVIKTHGSDIYERYLVDILYLERKASPEKILAEGQHLNQELLKEGLAVYDSR